MVFGWGKKKQDKTTRSDLEQEEKYITLEDVPEILDNLIQIRSQTILSESKSFRKYIVPRIEELLQIANTLERDNLDIDDIDKRLKTLVVRGKKHVISTIKTAASNKLADINTIEDVITFNNELGQVLKKIGDALGRQSRVIHIFAKKYAAQLKNILSDVNSQKNELFKILTNFNKFQNDIKEINSMLSQIKNSKQTIREKEKRKQELSEEELQKFSQKIDSAEKSINDIKSSSKYLEYLEVHKKIDQMQSHKYEIKQKIDNQFTKVSRPLSKYVYVSSLDKEQKSLLEKLVANPIDAIRKESKNDIIMILESVRKGILSGSVSVKDTEKSISHVIETSDMIQQFVEMISDFLTKHDKLTAQLKSFDTSQLENAQQTLKKNKENIIDCKSKIKTLESEIEELTRVQPELLPKIQRTLREISSVRYHIRTES